MSGRRLFNGEYTESEKDEVFIMSAQVRYFSRSGNTKAVAEAIANAVGAAAVSVDSPDAAVTQNTDVLFIGGALYAYGIDEKLSNYLKTADFSNVKKAVVFSTSWLSKHAVDLIKSALKDKGVAVADDFFHSRGKPGAKTLADAAAFAKKHA